MVPPPTWLTTRTAGVLAHISSLPGDYGIGNLGPGARTFVDFLAAAGIRHWQICPIGPTGYGDSPYQLFSGRAGNPYFIDLGELQAALAERIFVLDGAMGTTIRTYGLDEAAAATGQGRVAEGQQPPHGIIGRIGRRARDRGAHEARGRLDHPGHEANLQGRLSEGNRDQ